MVQLIYNDKHYADILQQYAQVCGGTIANNCLSLPPTFATGTVEVVILPNDLQISISNYVIHQDLLISRLKVKEEFYTLRFDELIITDELTLTIDNEAVSDRRHVRAAAMLTSSQFDMAYYGTKGTGIRGITILLDKAWLATYLGLKSQDEVLRHYISLKTASFNMEPLDATYRELMNEVLAETGWQQKSPIELMVLQNRIMLLVERFFTRLYNKLRDIKEPVLINNDEIQRIMDAEGLLVKDFSVPAPTIAELARHSAMSETKFKNQFRKIYKSGPYEYFQKNRMQRAKFLLLSGKYSVKETGLQLGYNNLSNFTIAFKKEFGLLPSEV
jgi:AraC-like DNA-binding protein